MAYKFEVGDKVRVTKAVLDGEVETGIREQERGALGAMTVREISSDNDGASYYMQENGYIFSEDWLESATEEATDNPWKLGEYETVGGFTVNGFGYVSGIPVYLCNTEPDDSGDGLTAVCVGANHLNTKAGRS